jgi:membrane protease YdiL (CAAX protease family)
VVSSVPPGSPRNGPEPGSPPGEPGALGAGDHEVSAPDDRRWPAWSAPLALLTAFGVAILAAATVSVVAAIGGADLDDPPAGVGIVATVFQDLALVLTAVWFARRARGRVTPSEFGLRPTRVVSAVGWMLLTWFGFVLFSGLWVSALDIDDKQDLSDLGVDSGTVALVAVAVLVTVVAPICEEVFFRGFFFTALRGRVGTGIAAVITGLVFGGIHAGSAPIGFLVPLAIFGFGLCLLYRRTGSLYPCIVLHALNNSLALGISEGWDWQVPLLMAGAVATIGFVLRPVARWRDPGPAWA